MHTLKRVVSSQTWNWMPLWLKQLKNDHNQAKSVLSRLNGSSLACQVPLVENPRGTISKPRRHLCDYGSPWNHCTWNVMQYHHHSAIPFDMRYCQTRPLSKQCIISEQDLAACQRPGGKPRRQLWQSWRDYCGGTSQGDRSTTMLIVYTAVEFCALHGATLLSVAHSGRVKAVLLRRSPGSWATGENTSLLRC